MPTPIGISTGHVHPGILSTEEHFCEENEVPVFVVSGRNVENADRLDPFGHERSPMPTLGIAYVSIGKGLSAEELHEETITDRKRKKAKVEFSRIELHSPLTDVDPWRVKDDVVRHTDNPWVQAIRKQLDESGSRHVTIYVHGYNTEFIDNTLLAAEIHHYRGRRGAVISFEWPSKSQLLGYIADKGNANFSTRTFRAMISNLAKELETESITIIAHSAGSPIVVNALREIRLLDYDLPAEQVFAKYGICHVVLAAPDMDLMAFTNAVHDRFYEVAGRVAVYASPRDTALRISEKLNGSKRLGRAVGRLQTAEMNTLLSVPQIEMIDASVAVNQYKDLIGHSYFHRDPWVSSDIGAFILGRLPEERNLVRDSNSVFWTFPTDYAERINASDDLLMANH